MVTNTPTATSGEYVPEIRRHFQLCVSLRSALAGVSRLPDIFSCLAELGQFQMAGNKYEGCGEIGGIQAIFLAQFHPDQGPMIRCQWPRDFLSRESFDSLSRFIIPKNEIQAQTVTVNCLGYKISGYPTYLHDKKYRRNYLLFNLCLVCHQWSRTVQFEPFVRKLAEFFANLEKESLLLSRGVEDESEDKVEQIEAMLAQVYDDMNREGRSVVVCGQNSLQVTSCPESSGTT